VFHYVRLSSKILIAASIFLRSGVVVKEHDGLIDLVLILCSSPWTNKYDPSLPDGALPSAQLRQLEVQANEVFDIYRDLYAPLP
jgi:hypothetical protein